MTHNKSFLMPLICVLGVCLLITTSCRKEYLCVCHTIGNDTKAVLYNPEDEIIKDRKSGAIEKCNLKDKTIGNINDKNDMGASITDCEIK